jgi:hypothetical protein
MSETDERLERHDVMLECLVAWTARQMEFNAELVQLNLVVDKRLARLEGRVDRLEGLGERHDAVLERLEASAAWHDATLERLEQLLADAARRRQRAPGGMNGRRRAPLR